MRFSAVIVLLTVVLLTGAATPLAAQHVRGTVREEGSTRPVYGAMVLLLDSQGGTRAQTLSDAAGEFVLAAGQPGRYSLLVQRIGFRDVRTAEFEVGTGVVTREVAVAAEAIVLESITAEARRRCVTQPEEGLVVATLWSEARKALQAAAYTDRTRQYRFTVNYYRRHLDARNLRIRQEETRSRTGYSDGSPVASLPAERLLSEGFVSLGDTASFYYAPDAHVLLSDGFADAYCFRVADQGRHPPELIGLWFEPADRRGPPAVRGSMWLDRRTFELRHIEYGYTRVTFPDGPADRIGGRVEYEAMPDGTWVVRRWWIRMPSVENRATPWRAAGQRVTPTIVALLEDGGEVLEVSDAARGNRLLGARLASITGVVFDSAAAIPLAGATVRIDGTAHQVEADQQGRYRIDQLAAGEYALSFAHPRTALYDVQLQPATVSVEQGAAVERDLGVPAGAANSGWAARCGPRALGPGESGVLHGRVIDEFTGTPLAEAVLAFRWPVDGQASAASRTVQADADGRYVACGLPESTSLAVTVTLGEHHAEHPAIEGPGAAGLAEREVTLRVAQPQPVVVLLQDHRSGRGIADATVALPNLQLTAVTDRQGRASFAAVPPGTHDFHIEHLSYGSHLRDLTVGTEPETFEVRVPERAIALEGVEVTVRSAVAEARRTRGTRINVMERSEIARLERTAEHVGHLAQRIPGLDMMEIHEKPGDLRSGICVRTMRGASASGVRPCVIIVLDGIPLQPQNTDVLLALPVDAIEAIEYLNPVEAGPRLGTIAGGAGALLVWTRGNGPYAQGAGRERAP